MTSRGLRSALESLGDRTLTFFAKATASLIDRFQGVDFLIAHHHTINSVIVAVMIKAQGVADFMDGNIGCALNQKLHGGIILCHRMQADDSSREAKVSVAEQKIVPCIWDDILRGDADADKTPWLMPAMNLIQKDIG